MEKRNFLVPPSGLKPAAIAIASMTVDLPLPFSPTKKVTLGCSSKVERSRKAGIEKGYLDGSVILSRSRAIERRKASLLTGALLVATRRPSLLTGGLRIRSSSLPRRQRSCPSPSDPDCPAGLALATISRRRS